MLTHNRAKSSCLWYYQTCLRLHPMRAECLCDYVVMPRLIVCSVTLWCVNVLARFKTLKDLSAVPVEGGIVRWIFTIQSRCWYNCCLQVSMSHKEGLILPGLWAIIPTLLSIFLFQGNLLLSLQNFLISIINKQCLNWLVLILVPNIDLRFPPNGFLARLTSDLETDNTVKFAIILYFFYLWMGTIS